MDGNISSSANLQNNTFFIKDKFQFNYLILRLTGVLAFCHNRSTQYNIYANTFYSSFSYKTTICFIMD